MLLSDIATINPGHPFRSKIPSIETGSTAVVQMKDCSKAAGLDWSQCQRTELTNKKAPDWLQTGDVLFLARGNSNYAVLVDTTHAPFPAVVTPHFYVLRVKEKNIYPAFLVWQLNQAPCQRYFEQNAEGTHAKSIRRQVLEETQIAIPSLRQQATIVKLSDGLRQQQLLMQELQQKDEQIMGAIAATLLD